MATSVHWTVAALAEFPGKVIQNVWIPMQIMNHVIDHRGEGVPCELISYNPQAEKEEASSLRVSELIQILNTMQDSAFGASGCRLDLDRSFGPLEVMAGSC